MDHLKIEDCILVGPSKEKVCNEFVKKDPYFLFSRPGQHVVTVTPCTVPEKALDSQKPCVNPVSIEVDIDPKDFSQKPIAEYARNINVFHNETFRLIHEVRKDQACFAELATKVARLSLPLTGSSRSLDAEQGMGLAATGPEGAIAERPTVLPLETGMAVSYRDVFEQSVDREEKVSLPKEDENQNIELPPPKSGGRYLAFPAACDR